MHLCDHPLKLTGFSTPILLGPLCGLALLAYAVQAQAIDPAKTVGPDECVDCHSESHSIWEETTHYKTYEELAAGWDGIDIAGKMDVDDIENVDAVCVTCHFTVIAEDDGFKEVVSGISCESCHGAAKDWLELHAEYPGDGPESETPEQKQERLAASEAAGMILPRRIHAIASNCLGCHTVPNEKLVNVGEHPAGSDEFELLAWSQGEVRHNVYWNDGAENAEASPERKRMLYVVGRGTDLQFSLKALALATQEGKYFTAMKERVEKAVANLEKINEAQALPEVTAMVETAKGAKLELGNSDALNAAAESVAAELDKFAGSHDGSQLAALDPLLPTEYHYSEKYK